MLIEDINNMVVEDLTNQFMDEICDEEEVKLQKSILISKFCKAKNEEEGILPSISNEVL